MNVRTVASFAVAVFLGMLAVFLVRGLVTGHEGSPRSGGGTTPVVVAAAPISKGAVLKQDMLKVVSFTTESVPAGSFPSPAQIIVAGQPPKVALRDMAANEPIVAAKISGPGAKSNLAGVLTPGMRAVGLRSGDVAGVGGFVLPGDRVDVLVTRQMGGGDKVTSVVQVLAEGARVLAVDQSSDADKPTVAKAVTVEVTPDQAQAISLAQAVGAVSLTLRQTTDQTPLARRVMTVADLGGPAPERPRAPHPLVRRSSGLTQVHVTRGVESSGYPVPN